MAGTLLIRADANASIGTGHIMRCLALAQAWQDLRGEVVFAIAAPGQSILQRLQAEGMKWVAVASASASRADASETASNARQLGASWVVVDGYHFGPEYHATLKSAGLNIVAIDDDGRCYSASADIIVNQNFGASAALYPQHPQRMTAARVCIGTDFVLLRREFVADAEKNRRPIPEIARHVLLSMGGSDPENLTLAVLEQLYGLGISGLQVDIVIGPENQFRDLIESFLARTGSAWRMHVDPANMSELMVANDVAIIAGGGTLWELMFMGVAVLSFARSEAQRPILERLHDDGLIEYLGNLSAIGRLGFVLPDVLQRSERRKEMRARGTRLIDGKGATRVINELKGGA